MTAAEAETGEAVFGEILDTGYATVADLAQQAIEPTDIEPGTIYVVADGPGKVRVITTDEYEDHPRHTAARRVVTDAASFVAYVNRHALSGTEIYAHTNSSSVVAVIDSHEGTHGDPGWQKHTLQLALEKSKAWQAWEKADGQLFDQGTFADFLDDRYLDVIDPDPARMIDIATTFQAKTKVDFDSAVRLDSGEVKLSYQETVATKAGQKGDIEIPKKIQLAIRPYIGGPIYSIWAHFRYRLQGSNVLMGFKLERPENVLEAAFADIVTEIRGGVLDKDGQPVDGAHTGVGTVPIFNGKHQ